MSDPNTRSENVEEQLRDSVQLLNDIIESSPDATMVIDTQGTIMYWNRAMAELTGYRSEDMVGKGDYEYALPFYNGERRPMLVDMIINPTLDIHDRYRFFSQEEDVLVTDKHQVYLKNEPKIMWGRAAPLYNSKGQVVGAIETIRDITERVQAEESLQKSHEQLEMLLNGTVHALAITTEKRDQYTAGHQSRVAALACSIAQEMGMSQQMTDNIRIAATLHDIGKLYVPLDILSQTSKLNDIQKLFVMTHCEAGYDIIRNVPFDGPIAQIIEQHHERLDGSGYPLGLQGTEILLEARVLAVADTVEAMSSPRPYRVALGIEQAVEEIKKNAGKLYEKAVVEACLRVIEQGNFQIATEI